MKFPPKLSLARLPTPIQRLERLSLEVGKEIFLWRDDLTGFAESGNKIRKLEFLLADALNQKATRILTAGGAQSNHTRATAFLARQLGLEISIVVREPRDGSKAEFNGNLLLNTLCGADLKFISYKTYQSAGSIYLPFLEELSHASQKKGERPYIIPEGGSVPLGCFGYVVAVKEMLETWKQTRLGTQGPDSLFCALGSGGTHAGLHLGFLLNDLSTDRLWAINVCDSEEYFQKRVGKLVQQTKEQFAVQVPESRLQILDGHFGAGYGIASDDDLKFYAKLAKQEGVLLDPVYTGKAFQGMLAEIKKTPERFGEKILFLHSGGAFANFAYAGQFKSVLPATV